MGTELQQFASVKCKFMDIVHSQEPDILNIHSLQIFYVIEGLLKSKQLNMQVVPL